MVETTRRRASGGGRARGLPLNLVLASNLVLAVVAVAWFAVNTRGPWGPPLLGWLPVLPSITLAGAVVRQVALSPGLPPSVRRFWLQMSMATAICAVGVTVYGYVALTDPRLPGEPERVPLVSLLLFLVTLLVSLWALLRIPVGTRSRSEWLRLGLDAATVMLGAALFIWYFAFTQLQSTSEGTNALWISVVTGALALVAVCAVTKVVLAGTGPVDSAALRLLALGMLVGGLSAGLHPLVVAQPQLASSQFSIPVISLFITWGGVRQRRAAGGEARLSPGRSREVRPYSLLPYAALAATDALLLLVAANYGDIRGLVVVIAAVGLTCLVGVRQLAAFLDNARLLLRLSEQEQRFRSLVQNASDITAIHNSDGTLTYVSPAVERVLGIPPALWLQRVITNELHPDDRAVVKRSLAELHHSPGGSVGYQVRLRHADGSWRWLDVTSTNLTNEPSVAGTVSNARDITEQRKLQGRLHHQASHDELTQLANRTLFGERVQAALADRTEGGGPTVLLVDLDDFKAVNDTLGHSVGDALLVAVADRLHECIRSGDIVARLGGDEFALLLHGVPLSGGVEVVERMLAGLAYPVLAQGHKLLVQASVGIADGGDEDDAGVLLRNADIAMYAAKDQGKGSYACYAPDMDARILQHAELGVQLQQALDGGQLHLLYQPVVTLPEGRIVCAEALVRWQHPTRGLISPVEFIPTAERTGLIVPLGRWVLREACRQAAAWRAAHGDAAPASVSVNVAARQLQEPGFVDDVAAALRDAGLEPPDLVLEATESAALTDGQVLQTLHQLHDLGVRLALDDFGTGQSSLGLLRTCPVDMLKLDKSFVDEVTFDERRTAVATAVILTARALGLEAIAEGIETSAQADRLWELGYQLGQGYHFARALPPDDVACLFAVLEEGADSSV